MLSWLFASKPDSTPTGATPKASPKIEEENSWMYDFVKGFLLSPLWRNPLVDFMEEHCVIFEDNEENKFEYTKIFKDFTELASILLCSAVEETGIPESILEQIIAMGLKKKDDRKVFQQLLVCDHFLAFKKMMVVKNKELQLEAAQEFNEKIPAQKRPIQIDTLELERLELEKAIAISLAMEAKLREQEERQLEEAIRLTMAEAKITDKNTEQPPIQSTVEQPQSSSAQRLKTKVVLPPLPLGTVRPLLSIPEYKAEQEKITETIGNIKKNEPQPPEQSSQARRQRLQEQRDLIRTKKQQERKAELAEFTQKQETSGGVAQASPEQIERRRKLMLKIKQQLKE